VKRLKGGQGRKQGVGVESGDPAEPCLAKQPGSRFAGLEIV